MPTSHIRVLFLLFCVTVWQIVRQIAGEMTTKSQTSAQEGRQNSIIIFRHSVHLS